MSEPIQEKQAQFHKDSVGGGLAEEDGLLQVFSLRCQEVLDDRLNE